MGSIAFLLWFVSIAACVVVAKEKGRSWIRWFFPGLLFGFTALIFLAAIPSREFEDSADSRLTGKWIASGKGRILLALGATVLSFIQISVLLSAIPTSQIAETAGTTNPTLTPASILTLTPQSSTASVLQPVSSPPSTQSTQSAQATQAPAPAPTPTPAFTLPAVVTARPTLTATAAPIPTAPATSPRPTATPVAVLAATPPRSQASSKVTSDSRVDGDARGRALANLEAAAPAEYAAWVDADGDAKTRAFADLHWAAPAESMALLRADGTVLGSVRGRAMLDLFEAAPAEYVAWIRGLRTEDDSGLRAQADLIEVATAEFVAFQRSSSDPGPALGNLVEVAPAEYVAWLRADSDTERHALANLIEAAPSEHLKYIRARGDTGRADMIDRR